MKVKTSGPADDEDERGKKTLMYSSQNKVNLLLQAYISRSFVEDFALVSDSAYVAQVRLSIVFWVRMIDLLPRMPVGSFEHF